LAITEDGESSGDFAADDLDAGGILELAGGLLETEVESFLFEVAEFGDEFVGRRLAGVFDFGLGHGWEADERWVRVGLRYADCG
jgi:hypothetical protein